MSPTDETLETTLAPVKEYRREFKLAREARQDAGEHEPLREDARGERHESVDGDDTKREEGSVDEHEEWQQAVDFAREPASESKMEWFKTMMTRI